MSSSGQIYTARQQHATVIMIHHAPTVNKSGESLLTQRINEIRHGLTLVAAAQVQRER